MILQAELTSQGSERTLVVDLFQESKKFVSYHRVPRKEFIFRCERAQGQYARFITYEASVLSLCSLPPEYKLFTR